MINVAEAEAVGAELLGAFVTPEARQDPYPVYEHLRETSPVLDSGVGFWILTRHADIRWVLRDPRFGSDEAQSLFNQTVKEEADEARPVDAIDAVELMLFMDPPDHTRLRKLVAHSFTPRRVAALRPRIAEIVDERLASVDPDGPFDVVADLAYPLATQVICELLGVPLSDRDTFGKWSSAIAQTVDPSYIRADEANRAIAEAAEAYLEYFDDLIDKRRQTPGDDLLSALIATEDLGDRLSHDELLAMGLLLLIAGHETTINLIGNGTLALLHDAAALDALRRNPSLDATAVDEFLRFDSPVQLTQRIALEDLELDGRAVPAGTSLILLLAAANRDPDVFDQPDVLRLDRPENPHVAFGGGIHHCLGAALARTEGEIAIPSLVRSSRRLELLEEPVRRSTFTLRGLERLVVSRR